jgi:hypothetical protein
MSYRFAEVEFIPLPFSQSSLGYIGIFLLLYIPVYVLRRRLKRRR